MKRSFRVFALLTIFTLVLNSLSILILTIKKSFLVILFTSLLSIVLVISVKQNVFAISNVINVPSSYTNTGTPRGMVLLPNGNIWYVDSENVRLVQYDPTINAIVRTVGRLGTAEGEFDVGIYSMTKDSEGYLYVLSSNCIIYKLDPNGGFIAKYNLINCGWSTGIAFDGYTNSLYIANQGIGNVTKYDLNGGFLAYISTSGVEPGQLNGARGIATNSNNGRIYVTSEGGGNRINVFDASGAFLYEITTWADIGGSSQLVNAQSIVVMSDGSFLAATQDGEHVIEKFNSSGSHVATFHGGDKHFTAPQFIVADSSGNFYVSEWTINAINKYNSDGNFINSFSFGNNSRTEGLLYTPTDVAYTGGANKLYVADGGLTPRVQEFDSSGSFIRTIIPSGTGLEMSRADFTNISFDAAGNLYNGGTNNINVFEKIGNNWAFHYSIPSPDGNMSPWFSRPVFDSNGYMYTADYLNGKIRKYVTDNGQYEFSNDFLTLTELGNYPISLAIDSHDNFFVILGDDLGMVKEFNSSGGFVKNIGEQGDTTDKYEWAVLLNVDKNTDYIYVSDIGSGLNGDKILVYSDSGDAGTLITTMGNRGGEKMQYFTPLGTVMNPATDTLTIAEKGNGRVQATLSGARTQILNLIPSANVIRLDEGHINQSLSKQFWDPNTDDLTDIPARLMFGDYAVADFTVDLTVDRDWATVNVQTLPWDSKSLVVNLNPDDAPGISDEHSLYLSRYSSQTSVTVCPNAVTLSGVAEGCSGEYILNEGDPGLTAVTIDGKNYWKIDGLTGTGAFSSLFETGFELSDVMTRQQISTASNHEITFGTSYDINHSGDTITISFSPEWDLGTIHLGDGDLSLYNWTGAMNLTLGASADTDIWGVEIVTDNVNQQIIFTAPTNANISDQSILADSVIKVFINNNVLVNPSSVDSYEITMQIITDTETNNENGLVQVPIVDSDTVNINGYVASNLFFDLDTGTGETPTWPTGQSGAVVDCEYNTCLAYEYGSEADNYTVDLGHLTMAYANKSNSASVEHTNGDNEVINSIYFDFSTNAASGGVITYKSLYGELRGPSHNADVDLDLDIPTTNGGVDIVAGTSGYGIQLDADPVYKSVGTGSQTVNCGDTSTSYCIMGDINPTTGINEQLSLPIYTVTGPIELGRGKIDVAAAIDGTVVPGSYYDYITFIATSIY